MIKKMVIFILNIFKKEKPEMIRAGGISFILHRCEKLFAHPFM